MSRGNANPRGNTVDGSAFGSPEVARNARAAHYRAGEIEEVWDTLGLSGGNERMSRRTCFYLSARPSTSPSHLETRGRADRPDLPLRQQADLVNEEQEKSKKLADLPPTRGEAAEAKLDLGEEGGSRQPRRCGR